MFKAVDLDKKQMVIFETFFDACAKCGNRTLIVRHVSERLHACVCWDCYCDLAADAMSSDLPEACHGDLGRSAADLALRNNYCHSGASRLPVPAEACPDWQTQLGVDPEKIRKNTHT